MNSALERFNEAVAHIGGGMAKMEPDADLGLVLEGAFSVDEMITITEAYKAYVKEVEDEDDAAYRSERPLRIAEGLEAEPEVLSHEEYMDRLQEEG